MRRPGLVVLAILTLLITTFTLACSNSAPAPAAPATSTAAAPKPAATTTTAAPAATTTAAAPKPTATATSAASAKTTEFKMVAYDLIDKDMMTMTRDFMKKVEERSKGALKFKFLGGPEVIPPLEQYEATQKGVVDACMIPGDYSSGAVPEVQSLHLTGLTAQEQRKAGVYDLLNKQYNAKGTYLMFNQDPSNFSETFAIFLSNKITTIDELKGLRIRGASSVATMLKALGASHVNLATQDVYTALERHMIDGTVTVFEPFITNAHYEVCKYYISPGFAAYDALFFFNLKTWNSVSPEMQKLMIDTTNEVEIYWQDKIKGIIYDPLFKTLADKGVQKIVLSKADGDKYVGVYKDLLWQEVLKASPDVGAKLKALSK